MESFFTDFSGQIIGAVAIIAVMRRDVSQLMRQIEKFESRLDNLENRMWGLVKVNSNGENRNA